MWLDAAMSNRKEVAGYEKREIAGRMFLCASGTNPDVYFFFFSVDLKEIDSSSFVFFTLLFPNV